MQKIDIDIIVKKTKSTLLKGGKRKKSFNNLKNKTISFEETIKYIFDNKILNEINHDINVIYFYNDITTFSSLYSSEVLFVKTLKNTFIECFLKEVKFCPYCGKVPLISFDIENENKIKRKRTFQLDHFFPKDIYPNLGLNLYNLIPSCSSCNHIKSNKNPKKNGIFHPYFGKVKLQNNKISLGGKNFDENLG